MKKILFLFLLFSPLLSQAQCFKTTVSLLGNLSFAQLHFVEREGNFNRMPKDMRGSIGVTVACYPKKSSNWYFSTGARFLSSGTNIGNAPDVPGLVAPTIYWKNWHDQLTIPLHIGKTFHPFKNSIFYIDAYGGISLGVIFIEGIQWGVVVQKSSVDNELVGAGVNGPRSVFDAQLDNNDLQFLTTLDLGINFPIIPRWPRLSAGVLLSYNIQESQSVQQDGFVSNASRGITQEYYYNLRSRYLNMAFSINYTFGKKWRNKIKLGNY